MSESAYVVTPAAPLAEALQAAARAAHHWQLPPPSLLRQGMNVIAAAGDDVVLRVSTPTAPAQQALWLSSLLTDAGIRVPRAMRRDVVRDGPFSVVAVERIRAEGAIDWVEVGRMVARVHSIPVEEITGRHPAPHASTFPWWDLPALLGEVSDLLDDSAHRALVEATERCATWVDRAPLVPEVLCHGDVHPGNVMSGPDGPVLLDWDLLCTGPACWDHAPLMTWTERWGGAPGIYEAFAAGYGRNSRGDPLAEQLAEARNVAATLLRLRAGRTDPAAAAEAARRLQYWRAPEGDAPFWTAQ